jgi:hypothetical protein
MTALRVIYIIAMGILLVTLVGVGIWAFYEGPSYSDFGSGYSSAGWDAYHAAQKTYHQNVLIIAYIIGLLFVSLGLWLKEKWNVMRSGLLLGGLLILIYGVSQGAGSVGGPATFVAVAIGLVVVLVLGYIKLVPKMKPSKPKPMDKEKGDEGY